MADGLRSAVSAEFLKKKLQAEVTLQRKDKDNPNNVYIQEELDEKIRAVTNLHPNHHLEPNDVFYDKLHDFATGDRACGTSPLHGSAQPCVSWQLPR